jgi:hypothetical protein
MKARARRRTLCCAIVAALGLACVFSAGWFARAGDAPALPSARLSVPQLATFDKQVTVRAADKGRPFVRLTDGHALSTDYEGPEELRSQLEQNEATPLALASADFDEDGVPDLVGGYAATQGGIITLLRGNVDAIYPNAPEAQRRKAAGAFTAAPFLAPARACAVPAAPDFLAAGDFDADGHWDIIAAERGGTTLTLLAGDGQGHLRAPRQRELAGAITALIAGDINRRDGLNDLIVGIENKTGAQVLIFESPHGAMAATPEAFALPAPANALAVGFLDDHYAADVAVAAGRELLLISGRDRKLRLAENISVSVPPAKLERQLFATNIRAVTVGDFTGDSRPDIALLDEEGRLSLLSRSKQVPQAKQTSRNATAWRCTSMSEARYAGVTQLLTTHVSSLPKADLLLLDAGGQQLRVLTPDKDGAAGAERTTIVDLSAAPVAVLPMRLDVDALNDLVVLHAGAAVPTILSTAVALETGVRPAALQAGVFSNTTPIIVPTSGNPPLAAAPYPSTITVSGQTGPLSRVRVQLKNLSVSSVDWLDVLLVGPSGQKVMLMSDAAFNASVTNIQLTFDDAATQSIATPLVSGTYKPTDVDTGPDTFSAPAPDGPYAATLATFNGTDPNGTWSLYVLNDSASFFNPGRIDGGWSLILDNPPSVNFVVTNTNDSGPGSLRQAILDANANPGADIISFQIGMGQQTIAPTTALPEIIDPVTIDGTTQPGFAGQPLIELSGPNPNTDGLVISAGQSVVRGLVINFWDAGIVLHTNGSNIVEGNYIGTNAAGTARFSNINGIEVGDEANLIGGTVAAARNVISGNTISGVQLSTQFGDTANHIIQGNYIGTDATGTNELKNGNHGISSRSAPGSDGNTIGGTTAGARNVISGNLFSNIDLVYPGSEGNLIQNNYIGTNAAGTGAIGGTVSGIDESSGARNNTIGGTVVSARNIISGSLHGVDIGQAGVIGITIGNLVEGNYIGTNASGTSAISNGAGIVVPANADGNQITNNRVAFNSGTGVALTDVNGGDTPGVRMVIVDNEIYANAGLGIDLGASGITPNDSGDGDTGPNFLQNFPVLTSVTFAPNGPSSRLVADALQATTITVNGTLNSTPNATFTVHWYFSADQQCTNNQQQSQPLVTGKLAAITTDAQGNAPFSFPFTFPTGISAGVINTTATDSQGNTSEFSACLPVVDTPPAPGTLQFSAATYSVGESGGSATVTVTRTNGTSSAVSVNYATSNGTATAGSDYTASSGTLNWADGDGASKTLTVPITNDALDEADETVSLTLSTPTGGATLGSQTTAVLTITDDDPTPSLSINDVTQAEGNSGTTNFTFTVSISAASGRAVSVNYATANGSATAGSDYTATSGTLTFNAGATSKPITVAVNGDTINEPNETFFVNLSNASSATIAKAQGTGTISNDDAAPTVQFSAANYSVGEGGARATLTAIRSGDASGTATIDYRTTDTDTFTVGCADTTNNHGAAYARCDFATVVGTLSFAAGETSKTITVPVIDDAHAEGNETFQVQLSNATNAGLGTLAAVTVTIQDNDAAGTPNPVYEPDPTKTARTISFFVRQQYLDFLSREPEPDEPWSGVLTRCLQLSGGDPNNINNTDPNSPSAGCDRIIVSQSFFGSPEFQLKGTYVFHFYKLAFNRLPEYTEIISDMSFVAGATADEVFARKAQLATLFTQRQDFQTAYGGLSNSAYVTTLLGRYQLTQVTTPDPQNPDGTQTVTLTSADLTNRLNNNTLTRAQVFRAIADSTAVRDAEFSNAFVAMQYYGYLRRKPEAGGYQNWLNYLTSHPNDSRTMVNGFLNSGEYRLRFGQP